MASTTDRVMDNIIRGCKIEARKQIKDELNFARQTIKDLKQNNINLRKKLKNAEDKIKRLSANPLKKREQNLKWKEQHLKELATYILKQLQKK